MGSDPASTNLRQSLDRAAVAAYATATADDNPIHLDDDTARAAGLDGAVAHGMLSVAIALEAARTSPGEALSLRAVRFLRPARVGAEILVDLHPDGNTWQFRVEASGQLLAEGTFLRLGHEGERC